MEWVWVLIAVVAVVIWRLARVRGTPSGPGLGGPAPRSAGRAGSAAAAVGGAVAVAPLTTDDARGALHPDNPDGAFMDGYVAGRSSERWERRATAGDPAWVAGPEQTHAGLGDDDIEAADDESLDHQWGSARADHAGTSRHGSREVWSDPDDTFHDDSSDDW